MEFIQKCTKNSRHNKRESMFKDGKCYGESKKLRNGKE